MKNIFYLEQFVPIGTFQLLNWNIWTTLTKEKIVQRGRHQYSGQTHISAEVRHVAAARLWCGGEALPIGLLNMVEKKPLGLATIGWLMCVHRRGCLMMLSEGSTGWS